MPCLIVMAWSFCVKAEPLGGECGVSRAGFLQRACLALLDSDGLELLCQGRAPWGEGGGGGGGGGGSVG